MSETEKTICKSLENALKLIPEPKKEYFLGFAEGVEARKAQEVLERITGKPGKPYPPEENRR